jgi:hypothetical protein
VYILSNYINAKMIPVETTSEIRRYREKRRMVEEVNSNMIYLIQSRTCVKKGLITIFNHILYFNQIYCTLINLTPSIILLFLTIFLYPYYSTAFSDFYYAFFLHRCNVFWYCSLFITLISSPSSPLLLHLHYQHLWGSCTSFLALS